MSTPQVTSDRSLPVSVPTWRDPRTRGACFDHLSMMIELVEHRWPSTQGQADRVEAACLILGASLKFDSAVMRGLQIAARFHALGTLGSDRLPCVDPVSGLWAEPGTVRETTAIGARLVNKAFPDFPEAVEGIWYQFERPDGKGPFGLSSDEIPVVAGIIALVAALDATALAQRQQGAASTSELKAMVERGVGTRFVFSAVEAFRRTSEKVLAILAPPELKASAGAVAAPAAKAVNRRVEPPTESHAAPPLTPIVDPKKLRDLIERGMRIRPFSESVNDLIALTSGAECSADDVADAVLRDQALSVRLLRVGNSSAYSRGRVVRTVHDAVVRIGIRQVRCVATALDMFEQFRGRVGDYLEPHLFREHSVATGILAALLAKAWGAEQPEDYMLWGMLHDVGRLILIEHAPGPYATTLETARRVDLPLHVVESKLLRWNHCEVLRRALKLWDFPAEVGPIVISHHLSIEQIRNLPGKQVKSVATIALANRMSHALALGASGDDLISPIEPLAAFLRIKADDISRIAVAACKETTELSYAALARGGAVGQSDGVSTIRERLPDEVNPIYISTPADIDEYGMWFDRICPPTSCAAPNLAIMHLRTPRELDTLLTLLTRRERKAGVSALPLLCLHASRAALDNVDERVWATLKTPARVSALIGAINTLMKTDESAQRGP